jgi:hypothetical protein
MGTSAHKVDAFSPAINPEVTTELLSKLNIEKYLDQLNQTVALTADERQHLVKLLSESVADTSIQHNQETPRQSRGFQQLSDVLISHAKLPQHLKAAVVKLEQLPDEATPVSGEFALGNILVANGLITRPQLELALIQQSKTGRMLGEELITAGHANSGQVEKGLIMQRKLVACALAVSVGLSPIAATTAEAAQTSAAMGVSVTVVAHAKMQTVFQETQLKISRDDIVRGFVEVAAASRFSVSTNSQSGYLLEFYPVGDIFKSVQIGGLGSPVHIGPDGGAIVQRGQLLANFTHELSFRFTLSADMLPGNYPWPLHLSVRAL